MPHASAERDGGSVGTREVIERHLAAVRRGDVPAVMAGFHDDAVLMACDGVLRGRVEITEGFERLIDGLFAPGRYDYILESFQTWGDTGQLVWHATCDGTVIPFATETYVVREGRIAAQTFAAIFEES